MGLFRGRFCESPLPIATPKLSAQFISRIRRTQTSTVLLAFLQKGSLSRAKPPRPLFLCSTNSNHPIGSIPLRCPEGFLLIKFPVDVFIKTNFSATFHRECEASLFWRFQTNPISDSIPAAGRCVEPHGQSPWPFAEAGLNQILIDHRLADQLIFPPTKLRTVCAQAV